MAIARDQYVKIYFKKITWNKQSKRVHNGFGGMRYGAKNQGRMWDMKSFSGGIRDEIVLVGPGCVPFVDETVGCSENKGRMQDQTRQKHDLD